MLEENQLHAESNHGLEQSESSSFTAPYRHKGYRRTLDALREALNRDSAVILKGVEGTGKTTLISELISEYQHKGVPVVSFTAAITKASQFYAQLADSLSVPKQKKDLVRALRNTKEAGQYCLVVIDQEAIQSSPEVADALKQLCQTSETTAGAIKLVIIRKDYLVIHTEGTPEADFHNWIKAEVTLDPLHTDDIEGYIYYLSAIKGLPPTPYEIGTDFIMIEQTEGRISRLKALLLPLIHKDVITRRDFTTTERNPKPLHRNHSVTIAAAFACILALGVGINHFLLSNDSAAIPASDTTQAPQPSVFAEPPASGQKSISVPAITPPSRTTENQRPTQPSDNESSLPVLAQADIGMTPTTAKNTSVKALDLETLDARKAQAISKDLTTLPQDAFQTEVKIKLLLLEQELTEAVVENNRLKIALLKATADQKAQPSSDLTPIQEMSPDEPLAKTSVTTKEDNATDPYIEQVEQAIAKSSEQDESLLPPQVVAQADIDIINTKSDQADKVRSSSTAEINSSMANPMPENNLTSAVSIIDNWQAAWQAKDHNRYIATYSPGFNGAYKTHQRWLKKRFDALNKPKWIKLNRSDFSKTQLTEKQIKFDFWLSYEAASGYKDKTLKRLTLEYIDDEWLISKEQNLKVDPLF